MHLGCGLRGHAKAAEELLRHPFDARARNALGATLLHAAAQGGLNALVAPLVAALGDPSAVDDAGSTVLHVAALVDRGVPKTALALLQAGADPRPEDAAGRTVLHLTTSPELTAAVLADETVSESEAGRSAERIVTESVIAHKVIFQLSWEVQKTCQISILLVNVLVVNRLLPLYIVKKRSLHSFCIKKRRFTRYSVLHTRSVLLQVAFANRRDSAGATALDCAAAAGAGECVRPSPAPRIMLAEVEAGEVYRTILLPEQCSRNGYTGTTTVLETF